jgi:hypothetical protein
MQVYDVPLGDGVGATLSNAAGKLGSILLVLHA